MNKGVFLNRDGVITQDPPHYACKPNQLKLIERSADAIRLLSEHRFKVVVVSNQSVVGRGYFKEEDVKAVNHVLEEEMHKRNVHIDAIYYCLHHPDDGCDCHKPKPGMLIMASKNLDINLKKSFMVGRIK